MTRTTSLTPKYIEHVFIHVFAPFFPLGNYMETVAMAQFKEVTGHEMK